MPLPLCGWHLFQETQFVQATSFSRTSLSFLTFQVNCLSCCLSRVENIARSHRVSPLRKSSASVSLVIFSKGDASTQASCFLSVQSDKLPQTQLQRAEVCRNPENFLLHRKVLRLPTLFTTGAAFRFSESRADMNFSACPYYK